MRCFSYSDCMKQSKFQNIQLPLLFTWSTIFFLALFGCEFTVDYVAKPGVSPVILTTSNLISIQGVPSSPIGLGQCIPLSIVLNDKNGAPAVAANDVEIQISASLSGAGENDVATQPSVNDVAFSMNADCSHPVNNLTVLANQSSVGFYFLGDVAGDLTIQATAANYILAKIQVHLLHYLCQNAVQPCNAPLGCKCIQTFNANGCALPPQIICPSPTPMVCPVGQHWLCSAPNKCECVTDACVHLGFNCDPPKGCHCVYPPAINGCGVPPSVVCDPK